MDDNNATLDIFEMVKQAADIQFDKMMLDMFKDNPFMVALYKLLGEYGIRGLRAHEFIMRFGALGDLMKGDAGDDKT